MTYAPHGAQRIAGEKIATAEEALWTFGHSGREDRAWLLTAIADETAARRAARPKERLMSLFVLFLVTGIIFSPPMR